MRRLLTIAILLLGCADDGSSDTTGGSVYSYTETTAVTGIGSSTGDDGDDDGWVAPDYGVPPGECHPDEPPCTPTSEEFGTEGLCVWSQSPYPSFRCIESWPGADLAGPFEPCQGKAYCSYGTLCRVDSGADDCAANSGVGCCLPYCQLGQWVSDQSDCPDGYKCAPTSDGLGDFGIGLCKVDG